MEIIEKITETQYVGRKESGVYENTRFLIETENILSVGDIISIKNPIEGKFQTLCELCREVYGGGEDYNEQMKQQAIDVRCGFISIEEVEYV